MVIWWALVATTELSGGASDLELSREPRVRFGSRGTHSNKGPSTLSARRSASPLKGTDACREGPCPTVEAIASVSTGVCGDCGRRCRVAEGSTLRCEADATCASTVSCRQRAGAVANESFWGRAKKSKEAEAEQAFDATSSCKYDPDPTKRLCWPRIMVLGSHKSGTTALFEYIVHHRTQIYSPGPKENNRICELNEERLLGYERAIGKSLVTKLEKSGNGDLEKLFTVEGTPSNTFCRGPDGLGARIALVEHAFRPLVVFVHRDPVDRAWSDFRYFATFNDDRCAASSDLFDESVANQTRTLRACAAYYAEGAGHGSRWEGADADPHARACDNELTRQLQPKLPYLPCTHLVRLLPGFSYYFESRWRREVPSDRFLSVRMEDMLSDEAFGTKLWTFLGVQLTYAPRFRGGPPTGRVPRKDPKLGWGHRPQSFNFTGVHVRQVTRKALVAFYRDFDTTVLDGAL